MDSLLILLTIVLGIPITVVFLAAVSGYFYLASELQHYLNFRHDLAGLRARHKLTEPKLDRFKPFLYTHHDFPCFSSLDLEIVEAYNLLYASLILVKGKLQTLPKMTELKMVYKPWDSWPLARKLKRSSMEVIQCFEEGETWQYFINNLDNLVGSFYSIRGDIAQEIKHTRDLIRNAQDTLTSLQQSGTVGLNDEDLKLRLLFEEIALLQSKINDVNEISQPEPKLLMDYRVKLDPICSDLFETEERCWQLRHRLFHIDRAQKWCQINIDYLQRVQNTLQSAIDEAQNQGMNMRPFQPGAATLYSSIQDVWAKYSQRTPETYALLGGRIGKMGLSQAEIPRLLEDQRSIYIQLNRLKTAFNQASREVERLDKAISLEWSLLINEEAKVHIFDLSRNEVAKSKAKRHETKLLIQKGDLESLSIVPTRVSKALEFIESSKELRVLFKHRRNRLKRMLLEYNSQLEKNTEQLANVIQGLIAFQYEFLPITKNSAEQWLIMISESQEQFRQCNRVNLESTSQSELEQNYQLSLKARKQLSTIHQTLSGLNTTLARFRELKIKIEEKHTTINELWIQSKELAGKKPIESWLNKFNVLSIEYSQWNKNWPSTIGSTYEVLFVQVSKLAKEITALNRLYQTQLLNFQIRIEDHLNELELLWRELEKMQKNHPRTSIEFRELRTPILVHRNEYDKPNHLPKELENLFNQIEAILNAVKEKKSKIEAEGKEYKDTLILTKKALEDVYRLCQDRENYISKTIAPGNWPIISQSDASYFQELMSDLLAQRTKVDSINNPKNELLADRLIYQLNTIRRDIRHIQEKIRNNNREIYNRYQHLEILDKTIDLLLRKINDQKNNSTISKDKRRELGNKYSKVKDLRDRARNNKSPSYNASCRFLYKAIDEAEAEVPEMKSQINEIKNFVYNYGIYNAQPNMGVQAARDIHGLDFDNFWRQVNSRLMEDANVKG